MAHPLVEAWIVLYGESPLLQAAMAQPPMPHHRSMQLYRMELPKPSSISIAYSLASNFLMEKTLRRRMEKGHASIPISIQHTT